MTVPIAEAEYAGIRWSLEETACPICDTNNKNILHAFGPFRARRCLNCGSYYLSPRAKENDLLKLYKSDLYYLDVNVDQGYENYCMEEPGIKKTSEERIKEIRKLSTGNRILDIGSALGYVVGTFRKSGFDAWGCEISDAAFKRMDNSVKPYIFHKDISEVPINRGFDVITCYDTIEHIYNQRRFFLEVWKRLNKKGYFIVTTPIIDYWINRIQGRRWVAYKIPQHIIYYSRKGFKIASTGLFEILNERMAYYYCSLHFLNIRLKRVLPGFGKLIASTNKLLGIDNFFLKTPTGMSEIVMQKKMKDYLK